MADPKPLTRDQLAKFLPDAEAVKRFERLFAVAGDLTPTDVVTLYRLTQEASIDAGTAQATAQSALDQLGQIVQDAAVNAVTADAKAEQALDLLSKIAQSLELLASAPATRNDNFVGTDYIDISTVAPTAVGGVPGRMKWNDTDGTLDLGLKGGNVTLQIGQENVLRVKNDEATQLTDGEVVYITGASGANLLVKRALADSDLTSASTIGVVTEPIAVNGQGFITTFGSVRGLNTNSFNEGDILYLSPTTPGAITNVKPVAPNHMVLVGYCTKKSGGNGEIFVKVDNGYEVDELHNVLIANPVLAGSLLIYDATIGVWKNARLTPGTNITITNADGSITIASTGTADATHAAASKVTPVDADEMPLSDSASSFSLKKLTWANLKATLASWINGNLIPASFTTLKASGAANMNSSLQVKGSSTVANAEMFFNATDTESRIHASSSSGVPKTLKFYGSGGASSSMDVSGSNVTMNVATILLGGTNLVATTNALANGAGASAGTLTNAPAAGNPTKWIAINDGGTVRYIPTW